MAHRPIYESEHVRITHDVLDGASSVIVFFSDFKEADRRRLFVIALKSSAT